uniref:NADH-ubiquinone oxidoreductase chain 4L n=1 Tax=Ceutorhynchus albosuturalis TaxID=342699 RepID=A0AA51NHF4_9CUCU|nr:NADH dehydrogenase subunit 4L [Ceutorhynchus albosuturalis]
MMMYYSIPFIILFFSSLFVYVLKYKHFLLMLLSLESMVLSLFMMLFIFLSTYFNEFFMLMFYLSMSVCESALGLSLLVLIIRTYGTDKIFMFDNLW